MSERDFSIGGTEFKLRKIDALKQFHIVRRVAPILSELLPVMKAIPKSADESQEKQLDQMAQFLNPIMEGISRLSDKDSEFVLHGLLASVEMKQGTGNYAVVSNGTMIMFSDLSLPVLIQLAGRAFMYNLSGFFSALPRS